MIKNLKGRETSTRHNMVSSEYNDRRKTTCNQISSDSRDMLMISDYIKDVMKSLDMMRSSQMLTDVTLDVDSVLYHAHRVVLVAASPYFKAMFMGGLKESQMSVVKIQDISSTIMHELINFMYTGQIRVTENNVCQLIPAAAMLQISNVIQACCNFLECQLEPSNALGIAQFADQYGCVQLSREANRYIERRFCRICQEEEFFQLNAQQLIQLIKRDELNVQDEKEVYNAVLQWVKYDEDNRHKEMQDILAVVRCHVLPPKFLNDQILKCDIIQKTPPCKEYLSKICKDLTQHLQISVKERTPNMPRVIYVVGGYYDHSMDVLERLNCEDKTWVQLDTLIVPRSGLASVVIKGQFYAVGGRNNTPGNSYDCDWVDRYNPIRDEWIPCQPMSCPRNRVGVAVLDGLLYAVGGEVCFKNLRTVERYDPETDKWTLVEPMRYGRIAAGVAVVNRLLYAIGGYDESSRHSTAECYHPENNEWTMISSMHIQRSGAGVCSLGKYIYVIGGFYGRQLNIVERYDTEYNIWEFRKNMRLPRSALSVVALDGKIYAMGGYDGKHFLREVEIYDPETDSWSDGTPMTSCTFFTE